MSAATSDHDPAGLVRAHTAACQSDAGFFAPDKISEPVCTCTLCAQRRRRERHGGDGRRDRAEVLDLREVRRRVTGGVRVAVLLGSRALRRRARRHRAKSSARRHVRDVRARALIPRAAQTNTARLGSG